MSNSIIDVGMVLKANTTVHWITVYMGWNMRIIWLLVTGKQRLYLGAGEIAITSSLITFPHFTIFVD